MAKILIVEDEILIARDLERLVRGLGHDVIGPFMNAIMAMTAAEDEGPDLALLDISLKGDRDGISLAAYLRESFDLPIIFITSRTDSDTLKRASSIASVGYIVKPFSRESVAANIALALETRSTALQLERLSETSQHWKQLKPSVLQKVKTYIGRNLGQEINIKQLADLADIGESCFSRRFKASEGVTPYQYVVRERVEEGKRLLRDSEWPIVEIANITGFSSQAHFSTAFKKVTGLSPLTYRRLG